eukprot:CAMPEP_0115092134 /NCGR_PEP_ID=MMETSP0227-20121206/26555_1 /TAXON_ID=89957 /ORGANISM="Polarella glacialis, Strain CCMP 1383" /LENGTH=386 /DNA_ID=CAMNT_0002483835 /DNA_START=9 /DNA_END=1169 /DNA_ORIENTATION=+
MMRTSVVSRQMVRSTFPQSGVRSVFAAAAKPQGAQWTKVPGVAGMAFAAGAAATVFTSQSKAARADGAAVPAFSMEASKFDQSQFYGRLMGMYEKIDPRTLLIPGPELASSQKMLEEFKALGKAPPGVTDEQLWNARRIVEAIIHPVTGEPIPAVGRMSAFVPMNVPLCAMMLSAATPIQNIGAQWLNQTYNVVNNYVNRSGATVEWTPLLTSYGLATSSAVGIAVGAGKLLQAVPALKVLGMFVPYLACIGAGSSNVAFTRMEEWNGSGIPVIDHEGKDLGYSKAAGKQAVLQTVVTRSCFLPIFPMVVPPLIMKSLATTLTFGPVAMVVEIAVIATALGCMLPVALSILPQTMEVGVGGLEPQFQNLKDSKGNSVTSVFANKGL